MQEESEQRVNTTAALNYLVGQFKEKRKITQCKVSSGTHWHMMLISEL